MNQNPGQSMGEKSVVAVDGPAGSGKSSVCAKVCETTGWTYVNTGFLYRAIAVLASRKNITADEDLVALVEDFAENLEWRPESQEILYRGEDLAPHLYSDDVGQKASAVAKNEKLRQALLAVQRQLALTPESGAMVDGRDIGTVVFPDAKLKIFLTASIEVRARRRLMQLQKEHEIDENSPEFIALKESIAKRDRQDQGRGHAPLKQADDAIKVDTSNLSEKEVVQTIIKLMEERGLIKNLV